MALNCMQYHHRKRLIAIFVTVAILIALVFVINPELRVLLLLTDSLGILCALAFCIGRGAMWTYPKALPWRPFDRLLCPVLFFVTYGVRCGVAG
jgi:hypothetical protein